MRTANPALNDSTFTNVGTGYAQAMTLQGTVNKTAVLLALLTTSALLTWDKVMASPGSAGVWIGGGAILGLILCLVTCFKPTWSPVTAPLYALAKGLFVGALSAMYQLRFEGSSIVLQAILLTVGVLLALLAAYTTRLIKATENFKLGVVAATGGIFLLYLATWVLSMFGVNVGFIHNGGALSIGISAFVIVIAALNLVLDFDFIENGCTQGAPKYMEWYAGFGLLVTLIWLYVEILRLLAMLAARRD